jgi:hypothetical protein
MSKTRALIQMHFGTFPVPAKSSAEFAGLLKEGMPNVKVPSFHPSETYELTTEIRITA